MELLNEGLAPTRSLFPPQAQPRHRPEVERAAALDAATVEQELARYAGALGAGLTLVMSTSAALLVGAGVAAHWAAPGFDPLPTTLAVGGLLGALGLSLGARTRFVAQVTGLGVRLGLDEVTARRQARELLARWFADSRR
jgi:hypothetical protein